MEVCLGTCESEGNCVPEGMCGASENVTVCLNVGLRVCFCDGVCACGAVGVSVRIPL